MSETADRYENEMEWNEMNKPAELLFNIIHIYSKAHT